MSNIFMQLNNKQPIEYGLNDSDIIYNISTNSIKHEVMTDLKSDVQISLSHIQLVEQLKQILSFLDSEKDGKYKPILRRLQTNDINVIIPDTTIINDDKRTSYLSKLSHNLAMLRRASSYDTKEIEAEIWENGTFEFGDEIADGNMIVNIVNCKWVKISSADIEPMITCDIDIAGKRKSNKNNTQLPKQSDYNKMCIVSQHFIIDGTELTNFINFEIEITNSGMELSTSFETSETSTQIIRKIYKASNIEICVKLHTKHNLHINAKNSPYSMMQHEYNFDGKMFFMRWKRINDGVIYLSKNNKNG